MLLGGLLFILFLLIAFNIWLDKLDEKGINLVEPEDKHS